MLSPGVGSGTTAGEADTPETRDAQGRNREAADCQTAPSAMPTQGAGPTVVVETSKGTFEFETYPNEAPRTVEHVLNL